MRLGRRGRSVPSGSDQRPGDRPLRIAVISNYLPSGSKIGVGHWVDQLSRVQVENGHQVVVFSACPPVDGAPYEVRQVPVGRRMRTFRFAWELRRVDFSEFDVLHAHGDDCLLWRRRAPVHIRTMHGSCFSEALRISGLRERVRMVALGIGELVSTLVADKTFVVSPPTRRWMPWVRGVLPAGADTRRFERPAGLERSEAPSILFVGTYGQRKRGHLVARAFAEQVRAAHPTAELWAVAEDFPPAPGVVGLGRVSDAELVSLYHRAWAFCLPSSYEGFGIPYVEALAADLPVVATSNPGSRFVLEDGRCGLLVGEDEIGRALSDLLGDPDARARWAAVGRRRAAELDLRTVAAAYERAYRTLGRAKVRHADRLTSHG